MGITHQLFVLSQFKNSQFVNYFVRRIVIILQVMSNLHEVFN